MSKNDETTSELLLCVYETEPEGCAKEEWTTDEFCDDETNTEVCNWDGGACCLDAINDSFCVECICNTDGLRHPSVNGGNFLPFRVIQM